MNIFDKELKDLNFVVFDLETTGLFPVSSRILEIGAVKFNLFNVIEKFQTLIDPEVIIPIESTEIHGITNDMILNKPIIQKSLPEFFDFIEDSILLAHNASFDVNFISYNISKYSFDFPSNIVLDTIALSKAFIKTSPDYKLSTLVKHLNLKNGSNTLTFHRALADAEHCMKLFWEIVKNMELLENSTFLELSKYSKNFNFSPIIKNNNEIEIPDLYSPIKNAILDSLKIKITYKRHNGEITSRTITPINFMKVNNKLYLEAYCHLRREKRNFKLSKILEFSV